MPSDKRLSGNAMQIKMTSNIVDRQRQIEDAAEVASQHFIPTTLMLNGTSDYRVSVFDIIQHLRRPLVIFITFGDADH